MGVNWAGPSVSGHHRSRAWVAAAVAITVAAIGVPALSANAAAPHRIGATPQVPRGAVRTGAPLGTATLHLDVELVPRDPTALTAFVHAVSDPKSPQYKHYLPKGQFDSLFGPTRATIDAVSARLRAAGLDPGPPTPDGLTIPVTTTVAAAGAAFGTGFASYRLAGGRVVFANTEAPALPATIAGDVTGVVGLDDIVAHTADSTAARHLRTGTVGARATPHSAVPQACDQATAALGGQDYWLPADLSDAYDTGGLYGGYGDTGRNVTIGLLELENYSPSDIAAYQNCFGTDVSVTATPVDGGPSAPPSESSGVGRETALGIEAVAGLAPGASVEVYQGPDAAVATDADVLAVEQRMADDDTAQVLSIGWSACELDLLQADPTMIDAEAGVFSVAAAQGQTTIAASGDFGSTGCDSDPSSPDASRLSVDDPAGQVDVTAVGGTRMTGLTTSGPITQSAWNDSEAPARATGGGVSTHSWLSGSANYQSGVTGAGYADACSAPSGATCRQVPDVAALADPFTGYVVAFGSSAPGGQDWWVLGGTSLAASLWAAIAALADASLPCAATGTVGLMNPGLYEHAGDLQDVATGGNVLAGSGYTGGLYPAGHGYDLTTGLGAPDAAALVEDLCASRGTAPASAYVSMAPERIMDTGTPGIGPGATAKLDFYGDPDNGFVPDTGVTAVVLNVTAVDPTETGYLTVYPDGTPRPASSNLDFAADQVVPNLVTVQLGTDGFVDFYNHVGNVEVIADLEGYYTILPSGASTYEPVTPERIMNETADGPGGHVVLPVAGHGGVPRTGVTGVIVNITETEPTDPSYLTVYPDATAQPFASNLNFAPGDTRANLVIVPVGSDGAINIFNHTGTVTVLADVEGYYTGGEAGLKFHATAPRRILDTRDGDGVAAGQATPIGGNSTLEFPVGDVNAVAGDSGPIASAGGVVLNVVATDPSKSSYLKVYPSNAGSPFVSNLDFAAGQTIANGVITGINGPDLTFYNHVGSVDVVADLFGYFSGD